MFGLLCDAVGVPVLPFDLAIVSESPNLPVGPAVSGEGIGRVDSCVRLVPSTRCGVGGESPVPRLDRVTGLLVVRAELARRGRLPTGPGRGRAGGGPRPMSSGMSRVPSSEVVGCGHWYCVPPAHRPAGGGC